MNPLIRYKGILFLLFAGFLMSLAFASSISNNSIGDSDGLNISPPPPDPPPLPLLPVPSRSTLDLSSSRPAGGNLLCSDENRYNKFLVAWSDGTIYLVDGQTGVPHWKLVTGTPFIQSKRADPDANYFMDFGDDGLLYEYSKNFGRRELNFTIAELVHEASIVEDSSFTFGSKETTLHFLNATNGEILSRHRLPASGTKGRVPLVEESLVASRLGSADGYIMLVRTDYTLSSIALPTDPTQISPDLEEPLWQLSHSHISAIYIRRGQPSDMGDKHALSSRCQIDLPVFFLLRNNSQKGVVNEYVMLSSTSYPRTLNGNQEKLMLPAPPGFVKNNGETFRSPFGDYKIQELPDYESSSINFSNNFPKATNHPISNHVVDKLNSRETTCGPGNLQSQSGEKCTDSNTSSTALDLFKDANILRRHDSAAKRSFSEMFTGVTYRKTAWIAISVLIVVLTPRLLKLKLAVKNNEQNNLKGKQSIIPKKKRSRKAGNMKNGMIVSNNEKVTSSGMVKAEADRYPHSQNYLLNSFRSITPDLDAGDGRWVGRLFVSNSEIGRGSNGTVVLEGVFDGRPVAVKRLLRANHDVATKEIENLIASDRHPNIVRLHGVEYDLDFVYISLERCLCSLSDLIQFCSDASLHPSDSENQTQISVNKQKISLYFKKDVKKDLELWSADGFPSVELLKLMRDVVAGLAHLHELGIIHRDMKPQNVLISTGRYMNAKLSDMGISKRLAEDMSSLSHHATGYGSSGWQAPEQLLHGRQTRAVDLFSLGCILFFCITKGKHPFGNHFERDSNIVNNRVDLFLVDHIPEAVDLLSQLLDRNPNMRLSAVEVLHHPLFWNSETRLAFLRDTSDRVELEDRENESELLKALEDVGSVAFGGKWGEKLDAAFITDMGRYRKYRFDCMRDLLRVVRNKLSHYRELPEELQEILGPVPEGFDRYFSSRFPNLLIEVYKVMREYCWYDDCFRKYFRGTLV